MTVPKHPFLLSSIIMILLLLGACGSAGNDPRPNPGTPAFTLTLNPTTVSVRQGSSGNVAVSLARQGGFDAEVGLLLADPPAGVSIDPLFVPANSSSGTLTLNVGAATAPGTYTLNLEAWGSGVQRKATLGLTVTDGTGPGSPITTSRLFLIDPSDVRNTTDPTIETDSKGGVHMVYPARMLGDAYYAYCPADCASLEQASFVKLPTEGTVDNAMLALDAQDRPHVLLSTYLRAYYATCEGDCTQSAAWTVSAILEHGTDDKREISGEAFALDPQGRPRFVMHTFRSLAPIGRPVPATYYVLCDTNCHSSAAWQVHKIADEIYQNSQLRFTTTGQPRLATVATLEGQGDQGAYLECDAACTNPDSWVGVTLTGAFSSRYVEGIDPAVSMALTEENAPRILLLSKDEAGTRKIIYFYCDTACNSGDTWGLEVLLDGNAIGAGLDLALDSQDRPRFVYTADHNILMGYCEANCAATGASWKLTEVEMTANLAQDPVVPYFNCSVSAWFFKNPSVAIGADGLPRVAFQAIDVSGPYGQPDPNHPRCGAGPDMMFSRFVQLAAYR